MYDVAEGFDAYKVYLALKQHFTSDYDYFRYNGKIRANVESFLKRNDRFFFRKLSKKYKDQELVQYFVSNFVISDTWIGNLVSHESEENYVQYKKRMESLTYNFHSELHFLFDSIREDGNNLNKLLLVENNSHPLLFKFFLKKKISIETIIIMDDILDFLRYWNNKIDDIIWEEQYRKISKYRSFLNYNKHAFKKILKETTDELRSREI